MYVLWPNPDMDGLNWEFYCTQCGDIHHRMPYPATWIDYEIPQSYGTICDACHARLCRGENDRGR